MKKLPKHLKMVQLNSWVLPADKRLIEKYARTMKVSESIVIRALISQIDRLLPANFEY